MNLVRTIFLCTGICLISGCMSSNQEVSSGGLDLQVALDKTTPAARALFEEMEWAIMADSFPRTTSVLLVKDGELQYEGYFGYGDADLLNDTRSATKSLTALGIGVAIERGLLSLEQPVFDFLEDLEPFEHDTPLKREITVADLLTMSSALNCNDNLGDSPGNEENMYPLMHWGRWAVDIPTREVYERDENGRGTFAYCTAGSFLLGQILERVTGHTVDDFFRDFLFDPLGIDTWQWGRSPSGEFMTGGGLRLRSRDLAKIGLMLLNDGQWNGRQVIPTQWISEATSPKVQAREGVGYGYQFWQHTWQTPCGPTPASYMSGNGGNKVLLFPEFNAVIVVTRQHYGQRGMHDQTDRLIEDYILAGMGCGG